MIEIEKRIRLNEEIKKILIADAQFLKQEEIIDEYYDNDCFEFTTNDIWLRNRNKKFELKIGIKGMGKADRYRELEDEQDIKKFLNIPDNVEIKDFLKEKGFEPFCELKTKSEKYKNGDFLIEIDQSEAQDFKYNSAEIELMVENENQIQEARDKIIDFLNSKNIPLERLFFAKIFEYIKEKRRSHFIELVKRGIV